MAVIDKTMVVVWTQSTRTTEDIVRAIPQSFRKQAADTNFFTSTDLSPLSEDHILLVSTEDTSRDVLGALETFALNTSCPILWFAERDPEKLAPAAIRNGVTSFILGGFATERIETHLKITLERYRVYQAYRSELLSAAEELETRKIIERAKGILMASKRMSEEDAYKTMRSKAMSQAKTLKEISQTILDMSDLLS